MTWLPPGQPCPSSDTPSRPWSPNSLMSLGSGCSSRKAFSTRGSNFFCAYCCAASRTARSSSLSCSSSRRGSCQSKLGFFMSFRLEGEHAVPILARRILAVVGDALQEDLVHLVLVRAARQREELLLRIVPSLRPEEFQRAAVAREVGADRRVQRVLGAHRLVDRHRHFLALHAH